MHSSRPTSVRFAFAVLGTALVLCLPFSARGQNAAAEPAPTKTGETAAVAEGLKVPDLRQHLDLTLEGKPDYRIAARDLVSFQIFEEVDTNSIQRVSASGEINVPMLGTVKIGGLTLREAEQKIAAAYVDGGYFIKPQIILSVQTYAPRSVSVLGQVNKPEQIEFPVEREVLGIIQAITLAGGFTRVAKIDDIKVLRNSGGKEEQFAINLSAYLDKKEGAEFKLQPDDIVYVPERVF